MNSIKLIHSIINAASTRDNHHLYEDAKRNGSVIHNMRISHVLPTPDASDAVVTLSEKEYYIVKKLMFRNTSYDNSAKLSKLLDGKTYAEKFKSAVSATGNIV